VLCCRIAINVITRSHHAHAISSAPRVIIDIYIYISHKRQLVPLSHTPITVIKIRRQTAPVNFSLVFAHAVRKKNYDQRKYYTPIVFTIQKKKTSQNRYSRNYCDLNNNKYKTSRITHTRDHSSSASTPHLNCRTRKIIIDQLWSFSSSLELKFPMMRNKGYTGWSDVFRQFYLSNTLTLIFNSRVRATAACVLLQLVTGEQARSCLYNIIGRHYR